MPNDIATKQDLVNRMKSVSGHVNGIVRMVDEDEYCIDIINQVQAVQAALNKVNVMLLDDHMQHCVSDALRSQDPDEKNRVLSELHEVFTTRSKIGDFATPLKS